MNEFVNTLLCCVDERPYRIRHDKESLLVSYHPCSCGQAIGAGANETRIKLDSHCLNQNLFVHEGKSREECRVLCAAQVECTYYEFYTEQGPFTRYRMLIHRTERLPGCFYISLFGYCVSFRHYNLNCIFIALRRPVPWLSNV